MTDAPRDSAVKSVSSRLTHATAIAATVLGLSGAAQAADLRMPIKAAPIPMAVFSWTGFYLGAEIGYAWGKDSTTEYLTGTNTLTGLGWNYPISGVTGGLFAGGNYQIGALVIGAEADIEAANIRGGFYDLPVGGSGDTRINWQGSMRGRLGFAVDRVLVYGTGGLAFANISHSNQNLVARTSEGVSAVRTGWTVGGGVEMAVTQQFLIRAEYRYTDYGKYRYDSIVTFPGLTAEQTPAFSAVRLGAAYRF